MDVEFWMLMGKKKSVSTDLGIYHLRSSSNAHNARGFSQDFRQETPERVTFLAPWLRQSVHCQRSGIRPDEYLTSVI